VGKNAKSRAAARGTNRDRRARLEELKAAQRRAQRRKTVLFWIGGLGAGAAIIGLAVGQQLLHKAAKNRAASAGYTAPVSAAEKAAGCTGVHNDPISPASQHYTTPIDYSHEKYGDTAGGTAPIPPSGGKHDPISLGDTVRFYPLSQQPRPERAVHNLEHGYVDLWYDSRVPTSQVAELATIAADPSMPRLLVVGWVEGNLPAGKPVVLTSWGRTERCSSVSASVVHAFYTAHVDATFAPERTAPPTTGAAQLPPNLLVPPGTPSTSVTMNPSPQPSTKPSATTQPSPTASATK